MKKPRHLFMILALSLCFVLSIRAVGTPDAGETARQMAASANDNAVSVEERQEALRKLEESVRLFLSVGDTVEAARVLNRMGRLRLILNGPQEAINSYHQALDLLKQRSATDVEVDSLNGLGPAYMLVRKKEQAVEALEGALMLSEQSGYIFGRAQALLRLSELQNYDNHAIALQTAQKALQLWQTLNDKEGLARTYAQIGRCYLAQNSLLEATQNYRQALDLWRSLSNQTEQAEALIMLGFIETRKAEWQSSISYLTQAQGMIDEKAEPVKMGQIAGGLAAAFNESGLPENGIIHYQRALNYYRQTQIPRAVMYANWGLGATYYLLGDYSAALTYLQQALEGVAQNSLDAAPTYEYLGRVYGARGEYDAALAHLQAALNIYRRAVNPKEAARVRGLMGQIYQQQGDLERAQQNYREALEAFLNLSDRVNQAAVYYALGRLELRRANYHAAEDYLRRSVEATENIRRVSTGSDLTTAFAASVHERYENYIDCLMRKHQLNPAQGLAVRAFEISELARARSLAELLRSTETNLVSGLEPQLAEKERALRQALRVKEGYKVTLLGSAYRKEELDDLEAELSRLEAEYKQLVATIRARHPSYEQITQPAAWGLQQIQEQVIADDQTVLLEYSLGEVRSYVWAVTRTGIKSYELPSQSAITTAAQRVYKLLSNPSTVDTENELQTAARELGRIILSPVAEQLSKRRIIVVADEALNYIPFQILPIPSSDHELLVSGYEVINAPSASILGELRQEASRRPPATKVLAAFGDPVFASNYALRKEGDGREPLVAMETNGAERLARVLRDIELIGDSFDPSVIQPLFYAGRELTNLRNVAAGGETLIVTDFAATREQLRNTDLTRYAILHFATHGFLDPKRPENSGLVLSTVDRKGQAQNGFIGLQDIYELNAPVELVVLSACRTALGKDVRGEGLLGLTRGFMYAGASGVVASLWRVDDEATAELMKQFYTNMLQRGMTSAAALRAAQNSIRQRPEWRSPYYWAAFTLQGDYRQVIRPSRASDATAWAQKTMLGAALISLLVLPAWWYRRYRLCTRRKKTAGYSTLKK